MRGTQVMPLRIHAHGSQSWFVSVWETNGDLSNNISLWVSSCRHAFLFSALTTSSYDYLSGPNTCPSGFIYRETQQLRSISLWHERDTWQDMFIPSSSLASLTSDSLSWFLRHLKREVQSLDWRDFLVSECSWILSCDSQCIILSLLPFFLGPLISSTASLTWCF